MKHRNLWIDGAWISGYGPELHSYSPATNEKIYTVVQASPSDVGRAVQAAENALETWSDLEWETRAEYLLRYRDILSFEKEKIAFTISQETGKPMWESRSETASMIAKIDTSIESYKERCPKREKEITAGKSVTRHKPHGVIAVLGPFNFPAHLPNGHIVPALLAGNTVVFKPSEHTPYTGILIAECWEKAELPKGVVNLVQGGKEVGKSLANNEMINGLFFTGSYAAGQKLMEQFAKTPEKILALELGGNNPLIVEKVKDPYAAAYTTILSAYITSGQRCSCARRLILLDNGKNSETFLNILQEMIAGIRVGSHELEPEPFMGPLIDERSALKMLSTQSLLRSLGGKTLIELKHLKENTGLVSPGLIDVTDAKDLPDEEIFGPLLQLIRVSDLDHAIHTANQTLYGLSAGILCDSRESYHTFYRKTRAGVVNWNTPLTGASGSAPFGGTGRSGNHRPSAYYAADYCAYPVASIESNSLKMPENTLPGLNLKSFT